MHNFTVQNVVSTTIGKVVSQEDNDQWCRQIVDSLHITRSRMPHGPNKEQTTKGLADAIVSKESHLWCRPRHIHQDLSEGLLFLDGTNVIVNIVMLKDGILVFHSLSSQGLGTSRLVGGKIPQEYLPGQCTAMRRDAVPTQGLEFRHIDNVGEQGGIQLPIFVGRASGDR